MYTVPVLLYYEEPSIWNLIAVFLASVPTSEQAQIIVMTTGSTSVCHS